MLTAQLQHAKNKLNYNSNYFLKSIFIKGPKKKKIPARAFRKKKIACSTNVIESLWEKRKKNILPTRLLQKKILDDQKSPTPRLKS